MDLMTRRRALMAQIGTVPEPILPSEYQEVEYIESNGTQWIDTGIAIVTLAALTTEWALRLIPTAVRTLIYAGVNASSKQIVSLSGRVRQDWAGRNSSYFSQNLKTDAVNTIMQKDGLFWLNEESVQINTTTSDVVTVYLFGKNMGDSPETGTLAWMRLYGFTAKTGSTKIADFVPCYRKLDTKPGLYDLVSRSFITNQGTGEFVVGADVN